MKTVWEGALSLPYKTNGAHLFIIYIMLNQFHRHSMYKNKARTSNKLATLLLEMYFVKVKLETIFYFKFVVAIGKPQAIVSYI